MFRSLLSKAGVKLRTRKGKASSQESNQSPLTSSGPSDMPAKHSGRVSSTVTNPPLSGPFAGASNFNANHGVFTDITVAGDLNIGVEMQGNALDLNKIPHAKGAAWRAGNHATCLKGTRKAELQRIEVWEIDKSMMIFWLNGVAGSGKSTIAQTFAKRCDAKRRLGATFFCSRDSEDRRNVRLIFPTLAHYLARNSPEFRAALMPTISRSADIVSDSLEVQFDELLIQPLMVAQIRTTIIIDALDECEDKESTSAILSVMARHIHKVPSVKFLVTGRPEPRIQSGFRLPSLRPRTEVFLLHEVNRESVDGDITLYLRTHLSKIGVNNGYEDSWPSNEEISAATKKCAGLFIVAYVIVKFVESKFHIPRDRLRIIINTDSTVREGGMGLDATYGQVFLHSVADVGSDDADFLFLLQIVVGCVVLVFNPLSCTSLATVLGITSERVELALRSLHSVFIVPGSKSDPIRICHKSLADYLTDANRCTDTRFYIDPPVHHLELGIRCLQLMKQGLKKNICDIPRYAMNADVNDLDGRREKDIGRGLEYACRSWAKHLRLGSREGGNVGVVVELLDEFFKQHLLQWLEVLSIVQDLRCAVYSLHDVASWVAEAVPSDISLFSIIHDSEKFLLRFFDAIESSATHIYESAIPLSPSTSLIRALYEDQMSKDVKIQDVDYTWDACMRTVQLQTKSYSVAFSHNDDLVAVGEDKGVEIFDTATGQRRATLRTDESVPSLAFSPGDDILVTGSESGLVSVWDLQTGGLAKALEGHTYRICWVEFSPCGSMVATCSKDHTIRIWNISSFDCKCVLEGHSGYVRSVCWSSTGAEVVSASDDTTVKLWSVPDKICTRTFTIHKKGVISVAFLPNSSLIASGSMDKTIKVFDAATGDVLHQISTNWDSAYLLRFLDREHIMYLTDCSLIVRDLANSVDVSRFNVEEYQSTNIFGVSSDGTRLALALYDVMGIWQTNSASQNPEVADHHTAQVNDTSFSSDGLLIATGSGDHTAKIWNASTGQCLTTFRGHRDGVRKVQISPDSTMCASWGFGVIRIWDVQTGNSIATLDPNYSVDDMCFSPDGSRLAVLWGHPNSVKLLEVATGECLAKIQLESWFYKISFDADGSSVIVRGKNNSSQRLRLSSDTSNLSSLPVFFVPVHDTVPLEVSDPRPEHQYRYDMKEGPWILDTRDRRLLYVLPDWQRHFHGTNVVFITRAGRVIFVYFRP